MNAGLTRAKGTNCKLVLHWRVRGWAGKDIGIWMDSDLMLQSAALRKQQIIFSPFRVHALALHALAQIHPKS